MLFVFLHLTVTLMVMVQKSTVKKYSFKAFFGKYWWVLLFMVLLITSGGVYGYNKYLDRQNIAEMKQLLADFEKLKTDVESETGEDLYIEASCGSVGKFATSYACSLYLENGGKKEYEYTKFTKKYISFDNKNYECRLITSVDAQARGSWSCIITIRKSNTMEAERIFYDYDTSPGSAI